MDRFAVNEARMLYFHRVVLDQARRTPTLIERAHQELDRMRFQRPNVENVWEEWGELLAGSLDALEAAVCAATPRGGLLRANSPMVAILAPEESKALWQRVALQQFVAYFLAAAEDLDLADDEQTAIAGITADILAGWRAAPPLSMTERTLERLKMLVGMRHALATLYPEAELRRAWLRSPVDTLAARPIDILVRGDGFALHEHLSASARRFLEPGDMPSH
ncbi:MAG: hypothetical protein M0006_01970 [Magnetospirillum sp.]|nr:hypothetical protein [Magnetospirillum sp.]